MPLDSLELRTSLQRVLVGLILILVPLTVFGFYVALQGDSQIRQMAGENIRSVTRNAADLTSQFIAGCLRDVSVIANNPSVVQAVVSANTDFCTLIFNQKNQASVQLDKASFIFAFISSSKASIQSVRSSNALQSFLFSSQSSRFSFSRTAILSSYVNRTR